MQTLITTAAKTFVFTSLFFVAVYVLEFLI